MAPGDDAQTQVQRLKVHEAKRFQREEEPRRGQSLGKGGEVGTGVGDPQAVLSAGQGSQEGRH